ncbi:MAG TPA: hypothetical protein PLH72_08055 [Vicinamibacterales bacterium]|nr:hypothetical protein [Vicinamibacterales bacterium]
MRLWVDDGKPWENLSYGHPEVRNLSPGRHVVKAHNTLFGTVREFEAASGEKVRVRCSNGLTGGGILTVLVLGVACLRVRLEQRPSA